MLIVFFFSCMCFSRHGICWELRQSLVQPPAESRITTAFRPGYVGHFWRWALKIFKDRLLMLYYPHHALFLFSFFSPWSVTVLPSFCYAAWWWTWLCLLSYLLGRVPFGYVPLKLFLLQAQQAQLTGHMFTCSLTMLVAPSWACSQSGAPKLDTRCQIWSNKGKKRTNIFL